MFHTIFFVPLYNALVFLTGSFGGSFALGVIALTIVVKIILYPLANASIRSQIEQKKLQPLTDEVRAKYPDKKEQSAKLLELYKEHKTNPMAGCLLLILQLPVIIALYRVVASGMVANPADLYSFVTFPETVKTLMFGFDLTQAHNILFALLAGLSQFLQMYWSPSLQSDPNTKDIAPKDTQAAMQASMTKSMKYTMPIMIIFFGYAVPGAVALYWIISNIFMIVQERLVMKKYASKKPA